MVREMSWFYLRPDALTVWRNPKVRRALQWYHKVMENKKPAKFKIARSIPVDERIFEADIQELWKEHDRLHEIFYKKWVKIREGLNDESNLETVEPSFLDLKVVIANRILEECTFCEKKCRVNRKETNRGACRLDSRSYVSSYFLHYGEEAPLVPSGTIFYSGCTFKCVFCQNHDISQEYPYPGIIVTPKALARIQEALREEGARNINHVGGDPTPNIHTILESLKYLEVNVPQLWNSNMYLTVESLKLIRDIIDIWLPDFKYWNDKCALRLSLTIRYRDVVTRNLKMISGHGDIIIRHLVMPNHLECCTKPVLEWIGKNMDREKTLVNVMSQYRPEFKVLSNPEKYHDISRPISNHEMDRAYKYAEQNKLLYDLV